MGILGGAKLTENNPVGQPLELVNTKPQVESLSKAGNVLRKDDSPGETKTSLSELESSQYPRYENVVQTKLALKVDRTPLETPVVALGDLTESQRQLAVKMLTEEAESFTQNEDNVGCI